MCQCVETHSTVCDTGRPYITDNPDPACTSMILDPYATPPPCNPSRCPGGGDEAAASAQGDIIFDETGSSSSSSSSSRACPYHKCCRVTVQAYRCLCCIDMPSAEACSHYAVYYEYRQQQSNYSLPAPLPHPIPDGDAYAYGFAPDETPGFVQFRAKLFAAGRRLLAARQRAADRMRWHREASGTAGAQVVLTQEAWQGCFDLLVAVREAWEGFRDLLELYFDHFEGWEGHNSIAAEFVEGARRRREWRLAAGMAVGSETDGDGGVMELVKRLLGMELGGDGQPLAIQFNGGEL